MTDQAEVVERLPAGRFTWERDLRSAPLSQRAKLVGLLMASYSNANGTSIRPGHTQLASDASTSIRTVIRAIGELQEAGFMDTITRGRSFGRGGGGFASEYRLTVPRANLLPANNMPPVAPSSENNNVPNVQNNVPSVQNNVPNGAEQCATTDTPPDHLTPDHLTTRHFHQSAEGHQGATLADAMATIENSAASNQDQEEREQAARKYLNDRPGEHAHVMAKARADLGDDAPTTKRLIYAAELAGWKWEKTA